MNNSVENNLFELQKHGGRPVACRLARLVDIPSVSRVHLSAFPGFFLSRLGYDFLCVMYRAFLYNASNIFLVFENEKMEVVGFVVGGFQEKGSDKFLALRYFFNFLWAALPAILGNPKFFIFRLISRFFDVGNKFVIPAGSVLLRSIGVVPSARGCGTSSSLIRTFERIAYQRGAGSIFLYTDSEDNGRAQNFYARHGYVVLNQLQQDGRRIMWLMSKNLKGVVYESV